MSRQQGLFPISGNFETRIAAPIDARLVANTIGNLTDTQYWVSSDNNVYLFQGITVAVWNDSNPENNGLYILVGEDYTDIINWLKVGASGVEVSYGQGLTITNDLLSVSLTQSSGLTFSSSGQLIIDTNDSLVINNNKLQVSGNSVYQSSNSLQTTGNNQFAGVSLIKTPLNHSSVKVFVNGQVLLLGDINDDCYFSSDSGVTAKTYSTLESGDELYFNGDLVGWNLSTEDRIILIYEANI